MRKTLLSLLLALVLCAGLAVPALAGGEADLGYPYLIITGADGAEANYPLSKDAAGTGWSWSAAGATLTLSDYQGGSVQFNGNYESGFDIQVVLNGSSTIDGSLWCYKFGNVGSDADSSITISGSGSLRVTDMVNTANCLLVMDSGSLTAEDESPYGDGLYSEVVMNGGTLTVNAGGAGGNALTLNGGLIRFAGNTNYSWYPDAPVRFNGGSLSVDAGAYFATEPPSGSYTITMADGSAGTMVVRNDTYVVEGAYPALFISEGATVPEEPEVPDEPEAIETPFTDVAGNAWYAQPVAWAMAQGITGGTTPTTFSPDSTCTTAQILTFLWRAAGTPVSSGTYSDIPAGEYYSTAASWARGEGLILDFDAGAPCTRAMVAEYLWKLEGSPAVAGNPFTDVDEGASYAQAVAWAAENDITGGTAPTTFSPDSTCTRGQIVTFLYRAFAE